MTRFKVDWNSFLIFMGLSAAFEKKVTFRKRPESARQRLIVSFLFPEFAS
jgi:hypothetical protein